jgi:hypothetical protein
VANPFDRDLPMVMFVMFVMFVMTMMTVPVASVCTRAVPSWWQSHHLHRHRLVNGVVNHLWHRLVNGLVNGVVNHLWHGVATDVNHSTRGAHTHGPHHLRGMCLRPANTGHCGQQTQAEAEQPAPPRSAQGRVRVSDKPAVCELWCAS